MQNLKPGARVIVRYGSGHTNEQIAVIASVLPDGNYRAHKWLMRSQRWTARVKIWPVEIVRRVQPVRAS